MKTGAARFKAELDEFLKNGGKFSRTGEIPTISTQKSRFSPVLAVSLINTEAFLTQDKVIGYSLKLAATLKAIKTGQVSDTRTLRQAGLRREDVFHLLYGALQNYAYAGNEEAMELFNLVIALAYMMAENSRATAEWHSHINHFKVHAAVFLSAADNNQSWREVCAKTGEILESWGDPVPPECVTAHAAINLEIDCQDLPKSDAAYDLIKDLRRRHGKGEIKASEAYIEINHSTGWQNASEILRVLWAEHYKSYYRFNRDLVSRKIIETGEEEAAALAESIKFISPQGLPYIKRPSAGNEKQTISLSFPGGVTIGNTSVMCKIGSRRILLDYGCTQYGKHPVWSPDMDMLDSVFITHAHNDHLSGLLDLYTREQYKGTWYATPQTRDFAALVLRDNVKIRNEFLCDEGAYSKHDVEKIMDNCKHVKIGASVSIGDKISVRALNSGHVAGACQFLVDTENASLLYTGDFNARKSLSVEEMEIPEEHVREKITAVITEGTYAFREETIVEAEAAKEDLLNKIRNAEGSPVLVPVLSLGRAQEVLSALSGSEYRVGVFGLANEMSRTSGIRYSENIVFTDMRYEEVQPDTFNVIVASAGCLQGGPSSYFYRTWEKIPVILTGYLFPGTPARNMPESIPRVIFSAHTPHQDWLKYLNSFPIPSCIIKRYSVT